MDRNQKDDTENQEINEFDSSSFEDSILDSETSLSLEKSDFEEADASPWQNLPIYILAFFITLSGLTAIVQPLATRLASHPKLINLLNIYDYYHWTKMVSVGFGLFLILLSFNLVKRKKIAWQLAFLSCLLSALAHLARAGLEYIVWLDDHQFSQLLPNFAALIPVLTAILLWYMKNKFTVRSDKADFGNGVFVFILASLSLLIYGTLGFWLLEIKDFGINFELLDSFNRTIQQLAFVGNDDLVPKSRFANWFLNSINIFEGLSFVYVISCLFKPIHYRLATISQERDLARDILEKHGQDALDNYKLLNDKSYYFNQSKTAMVAYKTVLNVAICLGDPVGPKNELTPLVKSFRQYCHDNDWKLSFLQVKPDLIKEYESIGMQTLKVGEDAIVDLKEFSGKTIKGKSFKSALKKLKKANFELNKYVPPHKETLIDQVEEISNQWLSLPGRKERGFSLGWFEREELQASTLYVLESEEEGAIAFVNQVRSYAPGQVSIDMMRHKKSTPNGSMDFLFAELLVALNDEGYESFSLGLAALSGVGDKEGATKEERAVHMIYEHMNRFFSYKGLRRYKSKFHPQWEERFLIYEGSTPGLIKTALAITRAGELNL